MFGKGVNRIDSTLNFLDLPLTQQRIWSSGSGGIPGCVNWVL